MTPFPASTPTRPGRSTLLLVTVLALTLALPTLVGGFLLVGGAPLLGVLVAAFGATLLAAALAGLVLAVRRVARPAPVH